MIDETNNWLPLEQAAKRLGYKHPESLRRRLRVLRKQGKVLDIGKPPGEYAVGKSDTKDKIILYWANPNTALLRKDIPPGLLIPKRGKRERTLK